MINIVKIISAELDNVNRRICKFYATSKRDVRTAFEALPFGIDSNPLKDMCAVYLETEKNGDKVIVGYLNKNCKAQSGETRFYSLDSNANEKTYIYLKVDGTIELGGDSDFAVKYNELETAFNTLKTDFNNAVTIFNAHIHPVSGAATLVSATPFTLSTADITPAKNANIKTS